MTCARVIRFLPGYLDGALPDRLGPDAHAVIGSHLDACPSCRRELERYRRDTGRRIDFNRAFWTGPMDAEKARRLENDQITALDLAHIVSITDHDTIEANLIIDNAPISCEWTVPFRGTILHLGIHNLPRESASAWIAGMNAFTAAPQESALDELLSAIHGLQSSLVVLNHPLWALDGQNVRHCVAMLDFLRKWFIFGWAHLSSAFARDGRPCPPAAPYLFFSVILMIGILYNYSHSHSPERRSVTGRWFG